MRHSLAAPVLAALLSLAGVANTAEFQPMGALGIGGAGVARTTNAMAGYWNPAGLAFHQKKVSVPVAVSTGLRVSDGLANNVDRLSNFTEEGPNGENSALDDLTQIDTGLANPKAVGDIVSILSVIKDMETQKGTLSVNGNAVVAVQVRHFAFGSFGSMEAYATPETDLVNILPSQEVGTGGGVIDTPLTLGEFAALAGSGVPESQAFFTDPNLRSGVVGSLTASGLSEVSANNVLNSLDQQLAASNQAGLTQQQAADVLINNLIPAFGSGQSIADNRSTVFLKGLAYLEFPISYGHPIDLGKYGKLGIGASIKPIRGRVYTSVLNLVEDDSVESDDITENLTENFEESNSITVDLGAFYKYKNWSVGLVAKNLTSPEFDAPQVKDQDGNLVLDENGTPVRNDKVKLKPQVRLGVAVDPFSWLTVAADLDLTDNDSVIAGFKSRNLGGGVELHPVTWFKLRAGMYKNLSNSEIGPVATAGLTFGTKWVNLELDGAYGLDKARYQEENYPKEAKVQGSLNVQF